MDRATRNLIQSKSGKVRISKIAPNKNDGQEGDMQLIKGTKAELNERLYLKVGDEWKIIPVENPPNIGSERIVPSVEKIQFKGKDALTIASSMTIHKPLILNSTLNVTGAITGNVTGNVSGTAATVTTAAQSNITSLGTLTSLTVDDITINGSTISDSGNFTIDVGGDITLDAAGGDITGALNGAAFFNCNYYRNRIGYHEGTTDGSGNIYVVFDSGDYDSRYGLFMYQKKTENSVWGLFAVYIDGSGGFTFVDVKDKDDHLTLTQQAVYEMKIAIDTGGDDRPVILIQLGGGLRVTAMNTTT